MADKPDPTKEEQKDADNQTPPDIAAVVPVTQTPSQRSAIALRNKLNELFGFFPVTDSEQDTDDEKVVSEDDEELETDTETETEDDVVKIVLCPDNEGLKALETNISGIGKTMKIILWSILYK